MRYLTALILCFTFAITSYAQTYPRYYNDSLILITHSQSLKLAMKLDTCQLVQVKYNLVKESDSICKVMLSDYDSVIAIHKKRQRRDKRRYGAIIIVLAIGLVLK